VDRSRRSVGPGRSNSLAGVVLVMVPMAVSRVRRRAVGSSRASLEILGGGRPRGVMMVATIFGEL
jgi:hypothetical protein